MRSSTWRLEDLRNVILNLGFVGENLHTRQIFDCKKMFDQYPNASVSMTVTPPEGEPYPGTIERDGDLVIWDVRDSDLVAEGDGEIQLVFTQEPHIARSYNARTHICRSQVPTGSIPSGLDDYITRADQLLDQVEDTFPAGGTTGQVLAKKSNTDYDTEWVDQGGGTEDYDELENRPQIGGVTLTGNKTLHDLGAASETDVEAKYTKPETGIPASDLAAGVIPDPEDLIDDTAGAGDTDKVWSADKSHELLTEINSKQDKPVAPVSIPFSFDKTWINGSGVAETDNNYMATDYIDVDDGVVAIAYTGKTGASRCVFWYDDQKAFISYSLQLNDRMAWFENILVYRPENAKYVRMQTKKMSASNPPAITPEVTAFYDDNYIETLKSGIVGDGVTDDTLAVRKIVNMCESVVFPHRDSILITDTIKIYLGYSRVIDGNGAGIIVNNDFYAFSVVGTLRTPSDATGMDAYVVKNEASCIIKNFRITSEDVTEGGGIEATKAFKLKICDNYIHHMKDGIRFYGRCRDVIISNNNVFAMTGNGILFDQEVDIHQCNILNNMLQYAHDVIHIYEPKAIANFQITGNDIEIEGYPAGTYNTATCIKFVSYDSTEQFSEIEITGNSIQGHQVSAFVCVFEGVDDHEIQNLVVVGNHISNSTDCAIKMEYVKNVTINGNNYTSITHYVYEMDGECTNVIITGESATSIGGKIHAASTAVLNGIKCKNVQFLTNDSNSIQTNNATGVDIYDDKDIEVSGSTPSITAAPNARYICGEVSTLSFTPCSSGMCAVQFTSGSSATVLTVPNTVKWSCDFNPASLDTGTTYELNIVDGIYGVVAKWA